jgi:chemotaxis-related protein WspB
VTRTGETLALLLYVGEDAYAVACRDVLSVVPRPLLRGVPTAPRDVLGVFVFRGGVVPVVDLSLRLGSPPTPDRLSSRVVLVRPKDRIVGVLAAQVSDVVRLPFKSHEAMRTEPSIASVVLHEGRTVLWLELGGLVPESVIELLEGAP